MTVYGVLRRIVRNDAIRVDPPEIYNWRVMAVAASVSTTVQVFKSHLVASMQRILTISNDVLTLELSSRHVVQVPCLE